MRYFDSTHLGSKSPSVAQALSFNYSGFDAYDNSFEVLSNKYN